MFEVAYLCSKDNWIEEVKNCVFVLSFVFKNARIPNPNENLHRLLLKGLFQRHFVNGAGKCPRLSVLRRMKLLCRSCLAIRVAFLFLLEAITGFEDMVSIHFIYSDRMRQ